MDISNLIVTIDLGSSNIVGLAGIKEGNKIKVVATEKVTSEGAIRRGSIVNIDVCASKVRDLITKLEEKLSTKIQGVYVGIGGQSLRTVKNNVSRHLPDGTKITSSLLEELNKEGRNIPISASEIVDVIANETYINDTMVSNPLGMEAKKIQLDMQLVVARQIISKNISTVFDKVGIPIIDLILSSKADAEAILTKEDKIKGCALVNLGGGITEVSIYTNGYLRQISTIPLGGKNITMDIMSLGLVSETAEQYKISIGGAILNNSNNYSNITLDAQSNGPIKPIDLIRVSVARVEEIVSNIVYQIQESGYKSAIKGGIIITGGASQLKDLPELLRKETGLDVHCGSISGRIILEQNVDIQIPMFSQAMGMLLIAGESIDKSSTKKEKTSWWNRLKIEKTEKSQKEETPKVKKEVEKEKPSKPQKEEKQAKTSLFDKIRNTVENIMEEDKNESIK
ncbi:MAG: cell division protein FtsA [Bacteroidales bacterium]|nr:cell division protein FtsA [Bacteroidales bacterium]